MQSFPATTDTVIEYLGELIDRGNISAESTRVHLSAISCRHTDLGQVSPCTDDGEPCSSSGDGYHLDIKKVLEGMAKGQAAAVDPRAPAPYKSYLPASVAGQALDAGLALAHQYRGNLSLLLSAHADAERLRGLVFLAFNFADFGRSDSHHSMLVDDVELLGNGDLFFSFRKVKGRGGKLLADDYLWPAHSCPALLELLSYWLKFRRLCESLPHDSPRMWRLPWESKKFTSSRLTKIFSQTLVSLGVSAPVGRYWTLHCVRAGAASEASALGLPLSKIRAFGGWGPRSQVPERRYIDPMCPQSAAGRRFFGWIIEPDGSLP